MLLGSHMLEPEKETFWVLFGLASSNRWLVTQYFSFDLSITNFSLSSKIQDQDHTPTILLMDGQVLTYYIPNNITMILRKFFFYNLSFKFIRTFGKAQDAVVQAQIKSDLGLIFNRSIIIT